MPTPLPPLTLGTPVADLFGVGPKRAAAFAALNIRRAGDLLYHFPLRQNDFGPVIPISDLQPDQLAHIRGEVTAVQARPWGPRPAVQLGVFDESAECSVRFFNSPWLADRFAPGQRLELYGKVRQGRYGPELINPRFRVRAESAGRTAAAPTPETIVETIYPASAELPSAAISTVIKRVLDPLLRQVQDPLPEPIRQAHDLPDLGWALRTIHRSTNVDEVTRARRRLAFEELLAFQTAVALLRLQRANSEHAMALPTAGWLDQRIRARFPFTLTPAQDAVITELCADLARPVPMNRLLQGDVGSGKTVVALYACLLAIAHQAQAAVLAPTELLAEQHYASVSRYLAKSQVNLGLLTGSTPPAERRRILAELADGRLHLVVGTHALLEEQVHFARLALAVIDEQHKFGVEQRAAMRRAVARDDGQPALTPHLLAMTATPIPRTLAMSVYGEMECSVMPGRPPGRQPIATRLLIPAQRADAYRLIMQHVQRGEQAYVVCPAIEAGDGGLRAAVSEQRRLQEGPLASAQVGLIHGQMTADERERAMTAFRARQCDVLVGTTVIEVGVDVPNATVMLVEHAERFGLSQLHQLRGRVGRGERPGVCLLLADGGGEVARERLGVLVKSDDGFLIAEEDLRLRGPGEFLGKAQSGLPAFRIADLVDDLPLLVVTRKVAAEWLARVAAEPGLRALHAAWLARVRQQFGADGRDLDVS